jgi:hypothetical protein
LFGAGIALLAGLTEAESPKQMSPTADGELSEVLVQADRHAIVDRVLGFVARAPYAYNDETLPRWNTPICAAILGLSPADGQFILTRVSEIAVSAGAPLAPQHCETNFVVVVTSDPVGLLNAWAARDRNRMFGDAGFSRISKFINTSRAVRVWYNSKSQATNGTTMMLSAAGPSGIDGGQPVQNNNHADGSRLEWNEVCSITSVAVIVDARLMTGFKIGQLAEYVAMVGLAEFNFDANIGATPTILGLFKDQAGPVPLSLSPWDEAFLNALYHVRQSSRLQTDLITQSMVRYITR